MLLYMAILQPTFTVYIKKNNKYHYTNQKTHSYSKQTYRKDP